MTKALDIADFIILECGWDHPPISNLEIQAYLYFCQARALIETGHPLIEDQSLYKWTYGAFEPTSYHAYKRYGHIPIRTPDNHMIIDPKTYKNNTVIQISEEAYNLIAPNEPIKQYWSVLTKNT